MIRRRTLVAALTLIAAPLAAQQVPPAPRALPRVALDTTAGRIVIEADTDHAPITAGNFLKYVDGKRLDGVVFYRVVKAADRFGFVQFGTNGDPRRVLPPIRHEPTTQTGLHHVEGAISVARFAPGTASGDFTISVGDQRPSLDADPARPGDNLGYAAFGRVVEGMDTIVSILNQPVSPTATVRGSFKGEVPVTEVRVLTARRLAPER